MPATRRFRRPSNGEFSLTDMRDAFTSSVDTLVEAIAEQNPKVDADGFETELRELVMRYGRGAGGFPPPVLSEAADVTPSRCPYSLSGDLLIAAHEAFEKKDFNSFFRNARDAFRSEDCSRLMAAISEMNSMTDVEEQAAMDLDDDENYDGDGDGDDYTEVDAGENDILVDEIDAENLEDDDPLAPDSIMASDDLDDPGDHEYRGDESEPPAPVPMSGDNPATARLNRAEAAFLNRVTISGETDARRQAHKAMTTARKQR